MHSISRSLSAAALPLASAAFAAVPLPALNVDTSQITVSGLSSGGYASVNGSNQNMGLWNVFVTTTLKQTGPNDHVIGTCS